MSANPRRSTRTGFTLIELLVVVVIIGLIAGIAVPWLLGRLQRGDGESSRASMPQVELAQAPPRALVLGDDGRTLGDAVLERTQVRIALRTAPVLEGFRVHTRYEARFDGTFVVRNPHPLASQLEVFFPFPPSISEARDVRLQVDLGGGMLVEPETVGYGLDGARWRGVVPPEGAVQMVFGYAATGRERFVYDVVGAGRSGQVEVELRLLDPESTVLVAPDALAPDVVEPRRLVWRFDNLITEAAIAIELPAGDSPLGRIILLCQLAALGVLLFGAGFWFLAEGHRPGMLDDFRLGHFLLLAINYALFFAIFAVIAYQGFLVLALVAAPAVALPLLGVHVARIAGLRFALQRSLPLAALTLATVLAAVYLPAQRPWIALALGVVVIGYVTLAYRGWNARRRDAREAERRARTRRANHGLLERSHEQLRAAVTEATEVVAEARSTLATSPDTRAARLEREALALALAEVDAILARVEAEGALPPDLDALDDDALRELGELGGKSHERLAARLRAALPAVHETCRALRERLHDAKLELARERQTLEHALDHARSELERAGTQPGAEALAETATLDPLAVRVGELRGALELAVGGAEAALADSGDASPDALGPHTSRLERQAELLHRALEALHAARSQSRSASHCPVCASSSAPGAVFCPDCGHARPVELVCRECAAPTSLMVHALAPDWAAQGDGLHCRACGAAFERASLPRGRAACELSAAPETRPAPGSPRA